MWDYVVEDLWQAAGVGALFILALLGIGVCFSRAETLAPEHQEHTNVPCTDAVHPITNGDVPSATPTTPSDNN